METNPHATFLCVMVFTLKDNFFNGKSKLYRNFRLSIPKKLPCYMEAIVLAIIQNKNIKKIIILYLFWETLTNNYFVFVLGLFMPLLIGQ